MNYESTDAPATSSATSRFVAGNAANGSGNEQGDHTILQPIP
jgi:hypothetical protein